MYTYVYIYIYTHVCAMSANIISVLLELQRHLHLPDNVLSTQTYR